MAEGFRFMPLSLVMHRKRAEDFGRFRKSLLESWDLPREKMVGFRVLHVFVGQMKKTE